MRLIIAPVILKVVDIVGIARAVDFHSLEELHELVEIRLSVDTQNVRKVHCACADVAEADHDQVDHVLEEVKLVPMRLHVSNQTHAELLRKLRILVVREV